MDIAHELRLAMRRTLRAPLFAGLVVIVQAFGIGITVSGAALLHALFQVHPIRDISNVVDVQRLRPSANLLSWSEVAYIASHQKVFSELLPWSCTFEPLTVPGRQPEWIPVESVGERYFHFVGRQVAIGRILLPEDNRDGSTPVAIISDSLWRRVFGADGNIIGRTLKIGSRVFSVVGVASPSFHGIARPNSSPTQTWVPLSTGRLTRPLGQEVDEQLGSLHLEGRLRRDVTMSQARAQVTLLAEQMDRESPTATGGNREPYAVRRIFRVRPADTIRIGEQDDVIGLPLGAVATVTVLTVFLIVCLNLAVLSVAWVSGRRHEVAVRITLGASRIRLAATHVLDAALVALAGSLGGALAAAVLLRRMVAVARHWPGFAKDFSASEGAAFLLPLMATAAVCFLIIGFSPALIFRRCRMASFLSMHGSVGGTRNRFTQRALIVGQIAVSFTLVSVAVLTGKQVALAAAHQPGIDLDRVAIVEPDYWLRAFGPVPPPQWRVRAAYGQLLMQVERLPGVQAAAISSGLPFGRATHVRGWVTSPEEPFAKGLFPGGYGTVVLVSSPEIFHTLGVGLLHGRFFNARDGDASEQVTVISSSTALKVFGAANPVGRRLLLLFQPWPGQTAGEVRALTVVGVVRDMDADQIGDRRQGIVFLPFAQHFHMAMSVIVRAVEPGRVVDAMRTVMWKVDPEAAVTFAGTGTAAGQAENLLLGGTARASGLLGVAALMFSMGGLGSVLWLMVTRRSREIGIRMALGATRAMIAGTVVRDGLRPVVVGILLGVLLSAVASMSVRPSFVEFVPALDPFVLGVVSLLIVVVALGTTYIPARQAARGNPQNALKEV